MLRIVFCFVLTASVTAAVGGAAPVAIDLSAGSVLLAVDDPTTPMNTAARVLVEEVERRTGLQWPLVSADPDAAALITLSLDEGLPDEGFRIVVSETDVSIAGADARGLLFGVGHFLRHLLWSDEEARYTQHKAVIASAPAYPIRGHQLGYRYQANSYDAWDDAQYEQYIRELALFGTNSIENIPFQDERESPHMPLDRRAMNRRMSEICAEYGLDYWVWTPAVFDLSDAAKRAAHLDEHEQLYADCPELTAVFFPGGDPGANPPELVLPFMEELAERLRRHHPEGKVWLSLQWFNAEQCEDIYTWIETEQPEWFGGLVAGPGSPAVPETRARLTKAYPLRHYPDITHTVRCQYPVPWWDPAYAVTLGREPINPQPVFYAFIHNTFAPYTDGFISYSDGMNDNVNKAVWSLRGWNPDYDVRAMLVEYARLFFGPELAERTADAILALEKNWEGPLAENGGVSATLALWQQLEGDAPALADNWRWQSLLVRAYYDAYTRYRLLYETALEEEANALLAQADALGAETAMTRALEMLNRAETAPRKAELRARIVALFDDLFHSIGLQSSVDKYQACGYERGCSLDFLDYPLNNRWWLEDQFTDVRTLSDEAERVEALQRYATWADPGPGSYYDNIGHVGHSPHVLRPEGLNTDPLMQRNINPGAWWWDDGFSRQRLSWQTTMIFPLTLVYDGLDRNARYALRMKGYGEARPRANGVALIPSLYEPETKEFPIPAALSANGALTIVFDPIDESELNWREHSRVAEAWLLKQ